MRVFHQTDFDFCTNLLIMSSSDGDVVSQKKKDEELVNWREYEAVKSHLTRGVLTRQMPLTRIFRT